LQIQNPRLKIHDLAIEGMSIAPTSQVIFKKWTHQKEDSIERTKVEHDEKGKEVQNTRFLLR
jgi:hypothetical protein